MSSSTKILVNDGRISKIKTADDISMVVKSGAKTILHQQYEPTTVNSNSVHWSIQVPSPDTLIDSSNIKLKGKLKFHFKKTILDGAGDPKAGELIITGAASAFPINTSTDLITLTLNGVNINVPMSGIRQMLLKQYDQKTISEYNNTCPSFVDTLYGKFIDGTFDALGDLPVANSSLADSSYTDDDVVKRGAFPVTYSVYYNSTVVGGWTKREPSDGTKDFKSTGDAIGGVYIVQCEMDVNEPLLGVPFDAFSNSSASLLGINRMEIKLNLNDCRNIFNDFGAYPVSEMAPGVNSTIAALHGEASTNFLLDKNCSVRLCQMNIHDSQYGKLKAQNTFPVTQYTAIETPRQVTSSVSTLVRSNVITLGSIPDKFYLQVRLPYEDQTAGVSNFKGYPITGIRITMNNEGNLLSDRDQHELFLLSKKNGCKQTWGEFSGKLSTYVSNSIESIGSYLVIDPVFDLGLSDMLSSGSLGTYSVQFHVTFEAPYTPASGNTPAVGSPYELAMMYTESALFSTKQGASSMESAYLTKDDVYKTKSSSSTPSIDYDMFMNEMQGGARKPINLSAIGESLGRAGDVYNASKKAYKNVSAAATGAGYNVSGGASNSLDKYI